MQGKLEEQMFLETADIETATADYASRFGGAAGEYFLEVQTKITLDLLRDLPKARVLDVGGGHAQLAEPLVKNGFEVTITGSDDGCRQRLDQRIDPVDFEYLTCDSLNLPFADRSFDVVLAFRLLPHVTRWRELLKEMARVADTCVILDYPDLRSSNILYEKFFSMKKKMEGNTRPFTLFSRPQLHQEMREHGFDKIRFRPEFFLPMVIHRKLASRRFSSTVEGLFKYSGMTSLFGSPIILRADRRN